jgi:DNA adenine methylase
MPEHTAAGTGDGWFNKNGPDAPIAWYGGKSLLARWIIEHFPQHRVYVEPFGGMANVLLKKARSEVEIFNDHDRRVTNRFRVIRHRESLAELKRLAELTPYSREEFSRLCEQPEPQEPIKRAYWFFVRCRQARGGIGMSAITANAWATSTRTRRGMPEPISKYLSAIDGLDKVADRFRQVVIEWQQAIDTIKKYDDTDTLFYCDPPYPAETRSGGKADTYAIEMTTADHERLLTTLRACKGRIVLSGYPSALYDQVLKGWRRIERPMHVQFSNSGANRTEVFWLNFSVEAGADVRPT